MTTREWWVFCWKSIECFVQCNPDCAFRNCSLFDVDCMTRQELIIPPCQNSHMDTKPDNRLLLTLSRCHWRLLSILAAVGAALQTSSFTLARAFAPARIQCLVPSRHPSYVLCARWCMPFLQHTSIAFDETENCILFHNRVVSKRVLLSFETGGRQVRNCTCPDPAVMQRVCTQCTVLKSVPGSKRQVFPL